jgi:hypothetical protein
MGWIWIWNENGMDGIRLLLVLWMKWRGVVVDGE